MGKKIGAIFLVLLWMMVIFSFSAKNGSSSSGMSRKVITTAVETFTEIEDETPEMDKVVKILSFPVRKGAHFFLYFVLGMLVFYALHLWGIKKRVILYAFFICALYAASDEWHQTFVATRSGEVKDVLLDSFASLLAIFLFSFVQIKRKRYE